MPVCRILLDLLVLYSVNRDIAYESRNLSRSAPLKYTLHYRYSCILPSPLNSSYVTAYHRVHIIIAVDVQLLHERYLLW